MSTHSGNDVSQWQGRECTYPTRDGRPFGESDLHRAVMISLINALQLHYDGQRAYVSSNILLFYRRGERRRFVSPDVLVVLDHDPGYRDHYLLWAEGRPPNIVIEVTSKKTRKEDLRKKFEIYRDEIGVAEYVLFDPREEYLKPSLQGYRLCDGRYEPIALVDGRLRSIELGLTFERDGEFLRLCDPSIQSWLPTTRDLAERESQRRHQAEFRRQEAEQQAQEAEQQAQKAEQQAQEAEQRRKLAEERLRLEEQRRLVAEEQSNRARAELERLRALLKQKGAEQ